MEQLRSPARLRDDAAALRDRLAGRGRPNPTAAPGSTSSSSRSRRRRPALAGETLPYLEHVARCFDHAPPAVPTPVREAAARASTRCSRATARSTERLAAWDARFEIPVDRLPGVVDWLVGALPRAAAADVRAARTARTCASRWSRGQPWGAYNWFDGGRRSRIDVNTDLPVRATGPARARRPRGVPGPPPRARLEGGRAGRPRRAASSRRSCSSTRPSASSARASPTSASGSRRRPSDRVDLLVELFDRAGLPIAADPAPRARRPS